MLPPIHVLEKQTVGAGGVASVTFNTIAAQIAIWDAFIQKTSRHLCILAYAASESAVDSRNLYVNFNGDAGNNYNDLYILGLNAAPSAAITTGATSAQVLNIPGTNYANAFGGGFILIPHAFNALNHKSMVALGGSAESNVGAYTNRWASNNAITSILLEPGVGDFVENSVFYLCVVDERAVIEEQLLTGDGTVTFSNIPQGDGNLIAIGYPRVDTAAASDTMSIELNADTTATNYFEQALNGIGVATGATSTNDNIISNCCPGANATANAFGAFIATIYQYAKGVNDPVILSLGGFHETVGPTGVVDNRSGRRNNVEAVTAIKFLPTTGGKKFKAGTLISLYYLPSPREIIERKEFVALELSKTFRCGDFDNDFEALVYHVYARTAKLGVSDNIHASFNDDTTVANYDRQYLQGAFAVVSAARSAANREWLEIVGDSEGVNEFGCGSLLLLNYANNYGHKHGLGISGRTENLIFLTSGRWENTDPITKITLTSTTGLGQNFVAGTFMEETGVVPLDTIITKPKDVAKQQQLLRPYGKRWRH